MKKNNYKVLKIIERCMIEDNYEYLDDFLKNNKVDFFNSYNGIILYEFIMEFCQDIYQLYNITKIISKYYVLLDNNEILNLNMIVYNLMRLELNIYYILLLELFLNSNLKESVLVEMLNRLNYEKDDLIKQLNIDITNKEELNNFNKYFYYSYVLIYSRLKKIKFAKRIINIDNTYNLDKIENHKSFIIVLQDKEEKTKIKIYDKSLENFIMELK